MAQWVTLRPVLELCTGDKVYEGGGRRREAWWCLEATEKKLQANFTGVSQEYKMRRRQGERGTQ